MPGREVKQVLASYRDEDEVLRYGLQGETVTVHPDHVKAFDEAQGGAPKDTPKRRTPTPKRKA
jgi:hypothetical protein